MSIDTLDTAVISPVLQSKFKLDFEKNADIKIDYDIPTFPFPNGVFLSKNISRGFLK